MRRAAATSVSWRARAAGLAAVLLLSACGVEAERQPEPVPAERLPRDSVAPNSPARAEQVRVWGARDRRLVPVFVELTDTGLRARVVALLALGDPGQRPPTALPEGTRLLRVEVDGDTVDLTLSEHVRAIEVADLPLALGQLVFTVTERPDVRRVQVRAGDSPLPYADASGRRILRPLVRSDFDGLVQRSTGD